MILLLDTCVFLWFALGARELSEKAREALLEPEAVRLLSASSAWEIAIKNSAGRLHLPAPVDAWLPMARERLAVTSLPVEESAALQVGKLPPLHRDPFDRILVAQAIVHGCVLVTPDEAIAAYPVRTLW